MPHMMGIDLGTSSLKVIIMDQSGTIRAQSSRSYLFDSPSGGYAEQDPETWWAACRECIREALKASRASPSEVEGVSFSGQMHGAVLLDAQSRAVRPAILHCDTRSGRQVTYLGARAKAENLEKKIFNPLYTGFLLPSLLWVRDNEPELYGKVARVCLPKDYLKMKLCGEVVSDYSDASATLAFDVEEFRWSEETLAAVDVPLELFPECLDSSAAVGRVSRRASEETGLSEGTVVVNGGGDQVMQAIGNGVTGPGKATVNIGSSGQVCFQCERPIRNPELSTNTFCSFRRGKWITMGATMSAGLSLKWFTGLFGKVDYAALNGEIARLGPGSGGLIFLPYLNGERTPHVNPDLSGAFFGINLSTDKFQMARAVMEGVAYSLMQCIEVCGRLGLNASELIASGGGARSAPWLQLQADIYGIPLKTSVNQEQAGTGAAIAAGVGVGVFGSMEEACARVVKYNDKVYVPNRENNRAYQDYYALFKKIYLSCHEEIQRVTELGRRR
jgi:xylulokinase